MYFGSKAIDLDDDDLSLNSLLPFSDDNFKQTNYRYEALERNGKQLPKDYILANLSVNKRHKRAYIQ